MHDATGVLVDPHTAVGIGAARACRTGESPMVALATAHPAKFPDAVERATGIRPELPDRLADLLDRPERFDVLPADVEAVRAHVLAAVDLTTRRSARRALQAVRGRGVASATLRDVKYVVCVPDGCADLPVAGSTGARRSRWRRCPRWPRSRREARSAGPR